LGWGHYASEPMRIHRVPGSHVTMMRPPHVRTLAGLMMEHLLVG
jgi:thioesterase domain-containing protein